MPYHVWEKPAEVVVKPSVKKRPKVTEQDMLVDYIVHKRNKRREKKEKLHSESD